MAEIAADGDEEEGGAGWIMTFADLMSLLMCFFVLLLSFAELDLLKFKAIAGSMKLAFGVQREVRGMEVPKGTSIIAQEFSAGKPDPTVINEVKQKTTDDDKQSLEFTDALVDDKDGTDPINDGGDGIDEQVMQAEADAERVTVALRNEIEDGMIEIETEGVSIIIRIREKGSFASGVARFDPDFEPVLSKLRTSLQSMPGTIVVAGHTDNVPISTHRFRSNWDLSSARAVSVVHALLNDQSLDPARFVAEGHGEAHPITDNDTAENRARNRRVEITIRQLPEVEQTSVDEVSDPESPPTADGSESASSGPEPLAGPASEMPQNNESTAMPELGVPAPAGVGSPGIQSALAAPAEEIESGPTPGTANDAPSPAVNASEDSSSAGLPKPSAIALPAASPFKSRPRRAPSTGGKPRGRLDVIRDSMQ